MVFNLQLLHASDLEGGVDAIDDASNFAAVVQGLETAASASSIPSILLSAGDNYLPGPFFSAAGDRSVRGALQTTYQNLFGQPGLDNIREGTGRVDISIANILGFDASAIGNHEFDAGTSTFEDIVGTDIRGDTLGDVRWLGAQFPYLSANLDFANSSLSDLFTSTIQSNTAFQSNPSDLTAAGDAPKIAPATIVERNGESIGIIGGTTPLLASITSVGDVTVKNPGAGTEDMASLASILQPVIDETIAQGVNKIVLVTHLQQFQLEQQLVPLLSGVDIAVAGGSDTILANDNDRLRAGDTAALGYPFLTTNADGDPAAILSTDGEYSYVGRLVVQFDDNGVLVPSSIDNTVSGPFATDSQGVTDVWNAFAPGQDPFADGTKGAEVKALTDAVAEVVSASDGNVFGQTATFIEGRREQVRTEETTLGNLTADANLFFAKARDTSVSVSLKNGGGIRAPIGEVGENGELLPPQANPTAGKESDRVSQLDIEGTLRFNNELSALTVTAEQLKDLLEHGVAATEDGSTPGQFPQVGGIAFSFDPSGTPLELALDEAGETITGIATKGDRVRSLAILDSNGNAIDTVVANGELVGDPTRPIRIVTLNFLADGGDDYPYEFFATQNGEAFTNRVDFFTGESSSFNAEGTEQRALADYFAAEFAARPFTVEELPAQFDQRIQNLSVRSDTVLQQTFFDLTSGADNVTLTEAALASFPNGLRALSGDDTVLGSASAEGLAGNDGRDVLKGNGGDDTLTGGLGSDDLGGGPGNDLLSGGFGLDTLTGGQDSDTFLLRTSGAVSDAAVADVVTDFLNGNDFIGLSSPLSESSLTFEQAGSDVLIRITSSNDILGRIQNVATADLAGRFVQVENFGFV